GVRRSGCLIFQGSGGVDQCTTVDDATAAAEGVGPVLNPVTAAIIEERSHIEQVAEERQCGPEAEFTSGNSRPPVYCRVADLVFTRLDDAVAVGVSVREDGPVPYAAQRVTLHMPLDEAQGDRCHSFAQIIQIVLVE